MSQQPPGPVGDIPVQPVPWTWTWGDARDPAGQPLKALRITHPSGVIVFFLPPADAARFAADAMRETGGGPKLAVATAMPSLGPFLNGAGPRSYPAR